MENDYFDALESRRDDAPQKEDASPQKESPEHIEGGDVENVRFFISVNDKKGDLFTTEHC